jgi:hypothetical protein
VPDNSLTTSSPASAAVPSSEGPAVLFTGEDGHLYTTEDQGRHSQRLSWKNEDFSMIPGMPALPGAAGDLEDDWHFAHPTPSPDGTQVAAFGLLPATDEELDELDFEDSDDEFGTVEDLAEMFDTIEAITDDQEYEEPLWVPSEGVEDDVAGPGLLPVSLTEGEIVAVPVGALMEAEDPNEQAYWPGARVYVMHRDRVRVWEAWGFDDGGPIHLDWSPSGEHVLVLHQNGDALDLHLVDPNEDEPKHIATGAPLFWAWQPGGPRLALRVVDPASGDPTLQIARPLENDTVRIVDDAGSFYAPAWRPDGSAFVYGSAGDREDRIVLAAPDGHALSDLIGYPGRAAFLWSPDGSQLAVPISPEGTGSFLALEILDVERGTSRTVYQEPFLAMAWLPDERGWVLCATDPKGGRLHWVKLDPGGGTRPIGPTFSPSQETLVSLHFFDQVTRGRSFLSADGSSLVWAGTPEEPVVSATSALAADARDEVPRILLASLGGGPTLAIGTGPYACFPGGPGNETRPR